MLDDRSIAVFPRIGTACARNIQASNDGKYLSFLWSEHGDEHLSLWRLDPLSGEKRCLLPAEVGYRSVEEMPLDVELQRERTRQRYLGIPSYAWFPDGLKILVPRADQLLVVEAKTGRYHTAVRAPAPIQAAKISPDGKKVAFACRNDLWLAEGFDRDAVEIRPLTTGGGDRLLNGVADFLAQEELNRYDAFWWHPRSNEIAFVQTDLRHVPVVGVPSGRTSETDFHPYSFSGSPIPSWQLARIRLTEAAVVWLTVDERLRDGYLGQAQFDQQGRFFVQILNRKQDHLSLLMLSPDESAGWRTVLEEHSDYWVSLPGNPIFLGNGDSFVRLSTGGEEKRIEVRSVGGGCRDIPTGDVRVDAIIGVFAGRKSVWFHGRRGAPENRYVFCVPLDGQGTVEAISATPGWHDAKLLPADLWLHTFESVESPSKLEVRNAKNTLLVELPGDPRSCEAASQLEPPEFFDVPGKDGVPLRACLYGGKRQASERLPLLVAVYGGPGVQSVRNAWDVRVDLRSQRFAASGVLVLKVDNRGSAGRGNAFERQINRRFGTVDVEDQVRGVRYLTDERKIADPTRVAVSGWSYGGYLSAMCLLSAGDVFRAAVAGAPVVSWHDYDACYTERYMGSPAEEEEAYKRADVRTYVHDGIGRLLIIHGWRDENVLFVHTAKLVRALNACQADCDLLILPEERHSVASFENRVLVERRVYQHVMKSLAAPAQGSAEPEDLSRVV